MKHSFTPVILRFATLSFALAAPSPVRAQGPLNPPPGPPGPVMKTLHQIEPRIPIGSDTTPGDASSLFKITQPGSYYLTGNLTGVEAKTGIYADVPGVTIDLNGFELVGPANSTSGSGIAGPNHIHLRLVIRNGTVRDWAFCGIL